MPDAPALTATAIYDGPGSLDEAPLVGIVLADGYEFDPDHDTFAAVAAFEVAGDGYTRPTASARVERIDGAWKLFIDAMSDVDLSDVDDRGGIFWGRDVSGLDAEIPTVVWADDPGGPIDPYHPTWDGGIVEFPITSITPRVDSLDARTVAGVAATGNDYPAGELTDAIGGGTGTAPSEHDTPIARGQRVDVAVVDGKLAHHNFVFTATVADPSKTAIGVLPDPELVDESERITFKSADGAVPASIVWRDHFESAAVLPLGNLFMSIIGAVGGSGVIDLTTATLGHPFVSKAVVDGDTLDSDPIDDTFTIDGGDGYAGVVALITALLAPHQDLGADLDLGAGMLYSPTIGPAGTIGWDPGQEAIPGTSGDVDLTDPGVIAVTPGLDTDRVCGAADAQNGGLDAHHWFDLEDYLFVGAGEEGTHNHTNNAQASQRTAVLAPVHAANNGGHAKWTAVTWPIRDGFIHVTVKDSGMWAGSPPQWLNDQVERLALALVDGLDGGQIPELGT